MTQSGQGNEPGIPAIPPAQPSQPREGIILPSQGDQWPPDQQQAAPAGGQAWGDPWGPQNVTQSGALPPEGAYVPPGGAPLDQWTPSQGVPLPPHAAPAVSAAEETRMLAPLTDHGAGPGGPGPGAPGPGGPASGGFDETRVLRPQVPPPGAPPQGPPPQGGAPYGAPPLPPPPSMPPPMPPGAAPGGAPSGAEETRMLAPLQQHSLPPAPPAGSAEATQFIPPFLSPTAGPGAGPGGAPGGTPGALPPESGPYAAPRESDTESTTTLRPIRSRRRPPGGAAPGQHQGLPPAAAQAQDQGPGHGRRRRAQPAPGPADETQVLPGPIPSAGPPPPGAGQRPGPEHQGGAPFAVRPGRPEDRQPPAEFDGLFRSEGPPPADATQQLPPYRGPGGPPPGPHGGPGPQGPQGPYEPHGRSDQHADRPRRRMSRAVVIGIVVACCAVAGLAAGAVLSSRGDDDKKDSSSEQTSGTDGGGKDTPAPDPAEPQAKSLATLLATSNNSRTSVIKAVENIKGCKDLKNAASDLRTAAKQRNDLVTALGKLTLDKLPDHALLTQSLTTGWKSSAAADNHYAAWADQVGGKKGCQKGKARRTGQVAQAEKSSGEATVAKKKASGLWNPLATKYGLTKREYTQL